MISDAQLDAAFSALAHPTRRAILARLAEGSATVNELAEPFDATLPAVSQHIRVLEAAGLITRTREAQFRPCALNTKPLEAIESWTAEYRYIWEGRFDAMDNIVRQMKDNTND
ncbi:helix-turn-helix transcriptional regulator [uncultured Roseobacter sp.]|uniref:ArsR/SmtB family transcription factor n=1 Tax=uncultured Roseobacter sp. TaxID=114847 RepID=UPI0026104FC6|nr:metalloregulator ArsR/SmtB family transcription factor [uncultured Roseobacter sp.]